MNRILSAAGRNSNLGVILSALEAPCDPLARRNSYQTGVLPNAIPRSAVSPQQCLQATIQSNVTRTSTHERWTWTMTTS
jgi:hypothetical protein